MKTTKQQIAEFFGKQRFVYATPGTDNHTANFYGMENICKLSKSDVLGCVDTARDWNNGENNEGYSEQEVLKIVLSDLQLARPK